MEEEGGRVMMMMDDSLDFAAGETAHAQMLR